MVLIKPTQPKTHSFSKSFADSKAFEAELDKHYGQAYEVQQASREQERLGIDRIFTHRLGGARYSVEYKTDHLTHETGNVFVETTSVDTAGRLGWAYTSVSQVLVYYVPGDEYALRADMTAVKRLVMQGVWSEYPKASAHNRGRDGKTYKTWGILVPVDEFRGVCVAVDDVGYPLDALETLEGPLGLCIHDLFYDECYVCGRVR